MAQGVSDRIKIVEKKVGWRGWSTLNSVTLDFRRTDGTWQRQVREVYERGHAAAILLYNLQKRTVILTRQFRLACWVSGYPDLLIEAPAGMLDQDNPEECIRRETEEETGFRIKEVRRICEAFSTPGSVTEKLTYFIAEYDDHQKVSAGGGSHEEGEDIEVLEIPFTDAYAMISRGAIVDAKTILLLQHAALSVFREATP